ncbi:sulfatase-like hydrolase/transferase [Celeribacter litoreus]|uniref:sulfatase-like hydrolase/transferase n=1 Tax=Celeribacter litoreus TaxID=2876714 RepID=UPI001CCD2744|nr:sulfatase-like hydrolase/transferase [Celeribacter litoreus]MCA0043914.1 sulfatase-like hydrolase/transferase [Celeribacter litoreus]
MGRFILALAPLAFCIVFIRELFPVLDFSANVLSILGAILMIHAGVLSLALLVIGRQAPRNSHVIFLFFLFLLILAVPFSFMKDAFGTRDVGSLLMTINENELGDMVSVGFDGFQSLIFDHLLRVCLLTLGAWLLVRYIWHGVPTLAVCSALLLLMSPLPQYFFRSIFPDPAHALIKTDDVVEGPIILEHPVKKKNLVIVYLESVERTYRDLDATAQAFQRLAALEDRGVSFRNLGQAYGTGFTAGGLVATQCGVPLLPRGAISVAKKIHDKTDIIPAATDFLSELTCLGDVLSADGYNASYINGSDLAIFSKGDFFRSHGYSRVMGLTSYDGWESETRRNVWGMDDDLLFERVSQELDFLAEQGAPFLLSTLTIATHGPDAFLDQTCRTVPEGESRIPEAIACTVAHVEALLAKIDDLGIQQDTLVLLTSDHLAFHNTLADQLRQAENRRNFSVVLGAGQGEILRSGSMFDIYPTLLELLGYRIENGRAALGQSLLSEDLTFAESEGLDVLNRAIKNNSELQRTIWSMR